MISAEKIIDEKISYVTRKKNMDSNDKQIDEMRD